MEFLEIEATESTPYVQCNAEEGRIEFKGRSIPENATNFYSPVISWIEQYAQNPGNKTSMEFYLDYINSISQKIILDILLKISEIQNNGKEVNVRWVFEEEDEEMEDEGKVFASKVNVNFELVSLEEGE